jgi:CheY-like chemotaxis protein
LPVYAAFPASNFTTKEETSMKHILIVDDEKLIRYSLSAALQNNDTEIITAEDGKAALKALGDWPFDFCFLDMQLPDMSGLDIMRTIKQLSPKTKIIIMTGSKVGETAMNAIREIAYLFISKPFDLFRVKKVLDRVSIRDENVFQELTELEARLTIERRQHRRLSAEKHITFVIANIGGGDHKRHHKADVLDISDTGTRIRTGYYLQPGGLVRFKNSMRKAKGIVRWSAIDQEKGVCVAGIQFVGPG